MQEPISIQEFSSRLTKNVSRVIKGKEDVIRKVVVCLLCGGHILLEDIPGTGKTTLVKTLARSVGGSFTRVQFTPDLLPSDLTGANIYNQKTQEFHFKPGPVFTNMLLADEINRATPRTQSSLLECMEEGQVTVDGQTHRLTPPFFVAATLLKSRVHFLCRRPSWTAFSCASLWDIPVRKASGKCSVPFRNPAH